MLLYSIRLFRITYPKNITKKTPSKNANLDLEVFKQLLFFQANKIKVIDVFHIFGPILIGLGQLVENWTER